MARPTQISVVKTAQMSNTLKLVRDGKVVGSVLVADDQTAELRDHRDKVLGRYADVSAAIAEFELATGFEEIALDL